MDADVVVIGAGAAGLIAARSLAERGLRVIAIEARERAGGRMVRVRGAELGAEFVHGPAAHTIALLAEIGSGTIPIGDESWTLEPGGTLTRDADAFSEAASLFEGVASLPRDESVDRFLRRLEENPANVADAAMARAFVEGFDAADPVHASAQAIAAEWQSGVDARAARPRDGYGVLVDHMYASATQAGVDFAFGTIVREIAWRDGVRVETRGAGASSRTYRARAAVVTLPLGVLQAPAAQGVTFDPALPAAKRDALLALHSGRAVRVALRFRTPFWERVAGGRYRDAAFFRSPALPFAAYWTQAPSRGCWIVAWAGGPRTVELEGFARGELVQRALDGFGTVLGEAGLTRGEFEEGLMHDWNGDPLARGAYSYVGVGGMGSRAVLAAPLDGVLFFAGEATAPEGFGGTVDGAFQTGARAADEAAAALSAGRP